MYSGFFVAMAAELKRTILHVSYEISSGCKEGKKDLEKTHYNKTYQFTRVLAKAFGRLLIVEPNCNKLSRILRALLASKVNCF
jgi:hypothetical protein